MLEMNLVVGKACLLVVVKVAKTVYHLGNSMEKMKGLSMLDELWSDIDLGFS